MTIISIIVPVYNASQFIERCMQSVEQQTLGELEVILVDDHGSDDSIAKAKRLAAQSQRKDICWRFEATPKNSGPAAARNLGLQLATGEYVAFLDADDYLEPDMYRVLYDQAKAHQADMSCCNAVQEFEDGAKSRVLTNPTVENGAFTVQAKKQFLTTFVAYFWTFIYRREWLIEKDLKFPDAKSAEDSSFLACCLLSANSIAQTDKPMYHYIIHSGSLTQRVEWKGKEKRRAFRAMLDYAKKQGLLDTYRWQLYYIYVKKALLVAVTDFVRQFLRALINVL